MKKRWRMLLALPVYPGVLGLGGFLLGFGWWRALLLGLLAVTASAATALMLKPKEEEILPAGWHGNLRKLKKTVSKIRNRSVFRGGSEILTELKQCESGFLYLSPTARREIGEYYLPTFLRFFTSYATFEECNEGDPAVLETMAQMERSIGETAENFKAACDRNDRTARLNLQAETAVLYKKLRGSGEERL